MKRLITAVFMMVAALFAIDMVQREQVSALPAGLVVAMSFSNGTGTTVTDHSGLNNNGTISGATWSTAGKYGGALSFDGVNDMVTINDAASLDLTNGMTLSAWVRPTTLTYWRTVIMKERPGHQSYGLYAHTPGNRPMVEISNPGVSTASGTSKLAANAWTYVSATYNGSQLRFYVNGSLVRTTNTTGNLIISNNALRIGGNAVWGEFYSGLIDEVRVYNRALSASEITSDMNTPLIDTTGPAVSISGPPSSPALTGVVNITANASDSSGIAGVQFLINGVAVGAEDTTSPYSYSWDTRTAANGSHGLSARARDTLGNLTTSAVANRTVNNPVDTTLPTVSITAPTPANPVSGTVTVTASASDNVGVAGVQFFVNGVAAGVEDTAAPYSYAWITTAVGDGPHALTARARDFIGNVSTSAAVTVNVQNGPDTIAPTVTLTAPTSTTPPLVGTVSLTATASDNVAVVGVTFLVDGVAVGPEDTQAPYSYSWSSTAVDNGPHAITARARDAVGNSTTSTPVNVTVNNPDTFPPAVALTAPPSTPSLTGNVDIKATATDNIGVVGVQFLLNGQSLGAEDTTAPYEYTWNTTSVANGPFGLSARARDAANNTTTTPTLNVTVANTGDAVPPTVAVTAPADGANVSGSVALEATASDDIGVVGVQFKVDGANVGAEDTTSPYAASWNSTGTSFGAHVVTAVARDASGKQTTSATVSVNIVDPNGADQIGSWSGVMNWPLVAVHAILLPNGNILIWDAWESQVTTARVWNPVANTFTNVYLDSQIFCAAHSYLPDGRILVTGGHDGGDFGIPDASIFDPANNTWTRIADMQVPRWYPTSVTLADGRVVVLGGEIAPGLYADFAEVYNPYANTWTVLNPNTGSLHDPEYPLAVLMPNNRVFAISLTHGTTHILDVVNQTWTDSTSVGTRRGSIAMIEPGKVLYTGGGTSSSVKDARIVDLTSGSPSWRTLTPMNFGRFTHNLVLMPDGKVMAIGGSTNTDQGSTSGVRTPEIWDPATETWKTVAPHAQNRMYHSTAMLLPDGRILSAGGGRLTPAVDYSTAEIYSPAYLFKGPRPTISGGPATLNQGSSFTLTTPNAASIAKVSLVGVGSVTHTLDMNQHFVPLSFTKNAGSLSVSLPSNPTATPPGPYMIFIVDENGVPSVAHMTRVQATVETVAPTVALTVPTNGATLSGVTQLSATASDASGIASVQFFAGTTSLGFATTTNPYTLAWNSSSITNGGYALTAVATDVYGNVQTSNPVNVTINNTAPPPPPGLVLALGFNEGTGLTTIDTSGSSNNGTVSQATWAAGKFGQALSFDGIDDWVTVADSPSLDLTNGMTVSAWVRPTVLSDYRTVVIKEQPTHLVYSLFAHAGSAPAAEISTGSTYTAVGTGGLPLATWTHLGITYDGSSLKLYVNGTLITTKAASGNMTISGSPLRIGGSSMWGEYFSGLIDEIRIFNRALTVTELQSMMSTPIQ